MMLRSLFDEVVRRRLWPIFVLAVVVAVAAPVLFLDPAPSDAPPASTAAPAQAPAGELPARAQRLIAGSDAEVAGARRTSSRKSDPFQAPSSHTDTKAAATGSSRSASGAAAGASGGASAGSTQPTTPSAGTPAPATPPAVPPSIGDGGDVTTARQVDVRFGKSIPAHLYRAIPRLQSFVAGGRVVAIFVKYSPRRDKAVFAIAPGTLVDGSIECRRKEGLCRYIDIPAGAGVRLITRGSSGGLVVRRLDVVRIAGASQATATAAASSAPADGTCMLGRMLALGASDLPPASDACTS